MAPFRRLSGSFTIEAADAIANDRSGGRPSTVDVLDDLTSEVINRSRPTSGETRYRLLELLRLYALTKLVENQEAEESTTTSARAILV